MRHDRANVIGDLVRGGLGLLITGIPLMTLTLHPAMLVILIALTGLFGWFLIRNTERLSTRIDVTAEQLTIKGWSSRTLIWSEMQRLQLRYFSTRRDRSDGWYQLVIRDQQGRKLTLESSIIDFDLLAEHAAAHAQRNQLLLDDTTVDNLLTIGVPADLLAIKEH